MIRVRGMDGSRVGGARFADLRGANVLVTGAAGALGSAAAGRLAGAGANLILSDRDGDALAPIVSVLAVHDVRVLAVPCDVLDDAAVQAMVARAEAELGPIDILVSCAGVEFNAGFDSASFDQLDRQLAIHLRSPMRLLHLVLPGMLGRGRGHVVVVSSLNGKVPFPGKVPYAAAKAGSIAMVHALRREYRNSPVDFSVVLPALVLGGGQASRAMARAGVRLPARAPTATIAQCADAILAAITQNRAEVTVSSRRTGPIAALQWSVPTVADGLLERSGMSDFWRRMSAPREES